MTTYAGVTFSVMAPGTAVPGWSQEPNIAVQHIPYSDRDDVQAAGLGNPRLQITAHIEDDAGVPALQAAVGITQRTLGDYFDTDWPNTMLIGVRNPRRFWSVDWLVELEFMRVAEVGS